MDLASGAGVVIGAVLLGIGGVLATLAVLAIWLCPVAWVLQQMARLVLRTQIAYGSAMTSMQIGLMSSLLAELLWSPLAAVVPMWVHIGAVLILPLLAMTLAVRLTIRDSEKRLPPWRQVFALALPATLTWWLSSAALMSVVLLFSRRTLPMMLGG